MKLGFEQSNPFFVQKNEIITYLIVIYFCYLSRWKRLN